MPAHLRVCTCRGARGSPARSVPHSRPPCHLRQRGLGVDVSGVRPLCPRRPPSRPKCAQSRRLDSGAWTSSASKWEENQLNNLGKPLRHRPTALVFSGSPQTLPSGHPHPLVLQQVPLRPGGKI